MTNFRRRTGILLAVALGTTALSPGPTAAGSAADGEAIFGRICFACHRIGAGRLVGPDLAGVRERHDLPWLHAFIKSSQTLVKQGDPAAVAIFEEYGRLPMPDNPLSDDDIDGVLAYIAEVESGTMEAPGIPGTSAGAAASAGPAREATEADVQLGRELFQGLTRFANSGAACNSCHHVRNDAVIGGGILAKELTSVFSRLGGVGVQAILGRPPFPVMEQAYKDRPLEEEEVFALVAFLQDTDAQQAYHHPRDYGFALLYAGLGGTGLLFGVYGLLWRGRKRNSTYQDIYDRQLRSQ